jgi:hypothetical protein
VNFGRGGLKKVVETEDARHVEAMHYADSAEIHISGENLKTIKARTSFWLPVRQENQNRFGRLESL